MENPLVAVITSSAVESRVRKRGFRSISQLLQPFATHSVSVRDPSTGQLVSANVTIDFNDLNKEGHLLTLSVLPHVLFEVLRSKSQLNDALDSFEAALRKWAEPAEQETFRTYLACIFVVAGGEEKPMSELSRLVQEQHAQQHSSGDSKGLTPSHCGPPRWTTPNTLKHYFLLHDAAEDDEARTTAVFNEMCSTYGMDYCQMLRIGDGVVSEDLPDVWRDSDELDAILNAGLRRALQHAAASAIAHQTLERKPSATSVSTISPSYAVVQSSCIPSTALNGYPGNGKSLSIGEHAISAADREALKNVTLSFQPESVEMQSRRLADLAFLFGLYSFAQSHYRSVKKDFEHSQAWLYHAAASEMAAVALYLSDNKVSPKQFPKHYFDAALENQLTYSGKYTCVVRCALNASMVLSKLSMFKEAATLLSTASSLDNDMCVAVTQAHASRNFEEAKMTRKAAFYRILAGNRFMKAGLKQNALECYSRALQKYANTNWDSIEDHLSTVLSADTSDKSLAVACAIRLLRESAIQTETNHAAFLDNFVETLTRFGVSSETDPLALPVPLLDVQATRVICGERPQSDDVPLNKSIAWIDIERAAYHTLAGSEGMQPFDGQELLPTLKFLPEESKKMKSVVHAVDERLRIHVAQKQWPLLDFRIARKNQPQVFCGQAVILSVEVENIGKELVNALCLATDGLDCVSVSLVDTRGKKLTVTVRAPALPGEESDIGLVFYYRGENLTYRQWQTVVSLRPVPLFESSAVLLDEVHGIVAINMRNVMPANDAALARCEVLRIRLVSQNINDKGCWTEVDHANVSLQPMKVGSQVQLDCEQSCNACIRISVPSGVKNEDYGVDGVSWWLSPMSVDPPSWPAALPNASRIVEDSQHPFDNYYQLAIFWKASVVDNDGHRSYTKFRLCQIPLEVLVTNVDHGKRSADLTLRYRPKVTEAVTSLTQLPPENRQQWWIDRELVRSVIKYGESHVFRFVISVCQPSVYDVAGSQLVLEAIFDDADVKVFKVC
ncbi:unnamed protein product [Haemonchus placei]|uniref:Foie-gras_1 domain-containing protein n=1 Tax=Haemonchus placei TaxID=6290 RepID=A0A0N4WFX8_HAEPC|nr:unnamed protein product [Haemonchus placei]